jgi:hypothetical protein
MPGGKSQILYDNLSKSGMNLGSYDDFMSKISDSTSRQHLYNNLVKLGYENLGDFKSFSQNLLPSNLPNPLQSGWLGSAQSEHSFKPLHESVEKDKVNFGQRMKPLLDGFLAANPTLQDVYDYVKTDKKNNITVGDRFRYVMDQMGKGEINLGSGTARLLTEIHQLANPWLIPKGTTVWKEGQKASDATGKFLTKYLQPPENSAEAEANKRIEEGKSTADEITRFGGQLANFMPSLAGADLTAGTSFFVDKYQSNYNDISKIKGVNELTKQTYATVGGALNMFLMKMPLGKALDKTIGDKIVADVSARSLKDAMVKSGGKITDDMIESAINDGKKTIMDRIKLGGVRGLRSLAEASVYNVGGAISDLANEKLANAVGGKQLFDVNKDAPEVIRQSLANTLAFAGLGAVHGAFHKSSIDNIRDQIAHAKSPLDIENVHQQINDLHAKGDITAQQAELFHQATNYYTEKNAKVPGDIEPAKKGKIFDLMAKSEEGNKHLQDLKEQQGNADPIFSDGYENQIKATQASIDLNEDRMKEVNSGQNFRYYEQGGKYYKQFMDKEPEEITPELYDLKKLNEDLSQTAERPFVAPLSEEQKEETNPVLNIPNKEIEDNKSYTLQYNLHPDQLPEDLSSHVTGVTPTPEGLITTVTMTGEQAKNIGTNNSTAKEISSIFGNTREYPRAIISQKSIDNEKIEQRQGGDAYPQGRNEEINEIGQAQPQTGENTQGEGIDEGKPGSQLTRQGSEVQGSPSLDDHLRMLEQERQRLTDRRQQFIDKGDKQNTGRLDKELALNESKKGFAEKFKMSLKDGLEKLKESGVLSIDCGGKKTKLRL